MSNSNTIIDQVIAICDEKKAENIATYRFKNSSVAECAVICSAQNPIQIKAIAFDLQKACKDGRISDIDPINSGNSNSGWVILDIPGVVSVHIMLQNVRDYYNLDQLYSQRTQ